MKETITDLIIKGAFVTEVWLMNYITDGVKLFIVSYENKIPLIQLIRNLKIISSVNVK